MGLDVPTAWFSPLFVTHTICVLRFPSARTHASTRRLFRTRKPSSPTPRLQDDDDSDDDDALLFFDDTIISVKEFFFEKQHSEEEFFVKELYHEQRRRRSSRRKERDAVLPRRCCEKRRVVPSSSSPSDIAARGSAQETETKPKRRRGKETRSGFCARVCVVIVR